MSRALYDERTFLCLLAWPTLFAAALCTIALSIVDAYFTLDLVSRGAEELNPSWPYYLEKSPLTFFTVKYLLTCAATIMILSVKEISVFGGTSQRNPLPLFHRCTGVRCTMAVGPAS